MLVALSSISLLDKILTEQLSNQKWCYFKDCFNLSAVLKNTMFLIKYSLLLYTDSNRILYCKTLLIMPSVINWNVLFINKVFVRLVLYEIHRKCFFQQQISKHFSLSFEVNDPIRPWVNVVMDLKVQFTLLNFLFSLWKIFNTNIFY